MAGARIALKVQHILDPGNKSWDIDVITQMATNVLTTELQI